MSNKPKILIFIDWFLPGYKAGGPVRSCANMIDALSKDYDFYVFTRNTDYTENKPYNDIAPNTWIQQDGFKAYYVSTQKLNRQTIEKILQENNFDVIYINGIYSKWFSLEPLKSAEKYSGHSKIIVATRGMLAPTAIKVKFLKKKIFILWANITGLYKKVVFHATNTNEQKQIYRKIIVADNFPRILKQTNNRIKEDGKLRLVCVARIAPEKNQLYALSVLKNCKEIIEFNLYGPIYNEYYWNECKKLIENMPSNISVNYHGTIEPENIAQILTEHDFLFMPTQGENYGHIIAESLSLGIPIIISNKTPWKNLQEQGAGYDIDLNDRQRFIDTIDKLALLKPKEYTQMSQQAKQNFNSSINNTLLIDNYKIMLDVK